MNQVERRLARLEQISPPNAGRHIIVWGPPEDAGSRVNGAGIAVGIMSVPENKALAYLETRGIKQGPDDRLLILPSHEWGARVS